jgi:serine O-acetyltransferase
MMNVATLGCLATRNCCNYFDSIFVKSVFYAPKISLIALSGDPFTYSETALNSLDPFRRDILSRDLKKTFWHDLERVHPDLLLIDFAEEVYDLIASQEEKSFVTNSDYLTRIKAPLLGEGLHLIPRESLNVEGLWGQACECFSRKVASLKVNTLVIRLYLPERYIAKGNICSYEGALLDKIKTINSRLDRYYSLFLQAVDCPAIDIPPELQISQFSDGKKIGITDYTKELSEFIAAQVASTCELGKYVVPSPMQKVDLYLREFAHLLDAGDIPTVYELYTRGKALQSAGDEKGAVRCERLITLLRNCSVPLTAELGIVKFGNGVTINANAKIGDYVTIGANVTVGGGSPRRDKHGVTRKVPVIGNRVYIATGAKILGGLEIGNHCVIGANAVVTKDVPDFSVVAGVPGKVVATITGDNLPKYSGYLYKGMALSDVRKMMFGC